MAPSGMLGQINNFAADVQVERNVSFDLCLCVLELVRFVS